jgi:hypothetical protein
MTLTALKSRGATIVLHGVENACGFLYRINIAFPLNLIDDASAIEADFQGRFAETNAESEVSAAATANPPDSPII